MPAARTCAQRCAKSCCGAVDSQEEHSGATHKGPWEPRLLPSHNPIASQDHLAPGLQLLLQLGRFLSLNTEKRLEQAFHTHKQPSASTSGSWKFPSENTPALCCSFSVY